MRLQQNTDGFYLEGSNMTYWQTQSLHRSEREPWWSDPSAPWDEMPPKDKLELISVGYWSDHQSDDLPTPQEGTNFDQDVIDYLNNGKVRHLWRGSSRCRLCGMSNGSRCLTDGTYMWPQGLAHYVQDHGTPLPQEFTDHISKLLNNQ